MKPRNHQAHRHTMSLPVIATAIVFVVAPAASGASTNSGLVVASSQSLAGATSFGPLACSAQTCIAAGGSPGAAIFVNVAAGTEPSVIETVSVDGSVTFNDAACTSGGWCVFVGTVVNKDGNSRALVVRSLGGTWTVDPALWPDGSGALAVGCAAATCEVAGSDSNSAITETVTATNFSSPVPLATAPGAKSEITSVACSSASCIALGDTIDSDAVTHAFVVVASGTIRPIGPRASQSTPGAVACLAGGWCLATVTSTNSSGRADAWSNVIAGEVVGPARLIGSNLKGAGLRISTVTCQISQNCVGVGSFVDGTGRVRGILASYSALGWNPVSMLLAGHDPVVPTALRCSSSSSCVVGGLARGADGSSRPVLSWQFQGHPRQPSFVATSANSGNSGQLSGIALTPTTVVFDGFVTDANGRCFGFVGWSR